jgi:hypothetical protein
MLTGPLLRRPVPRGRQRAGKAEAVKVDAPARRASRYAQDGKPQTAQNNRPGTTQTATVTTRLPLISAGVCVLFGAGADYGALAARLYGVGPVTALAITCWLGGEGRFSSSRKAVRFAGLDITVSSSDRKGPPGKLSRQGPPVLRWAVYEAGKAHARTSAPDHGYYVLSAFEDADGAGGWRR